jgi:hypothetical protein
MSIQGLVTTQGIAKSVEAENNEGFRVKPTAFAVSEESGVLDPSRDLASVKPIWYQGAISSVSVIDANTLQFNCNIPAQVSPIERYTKEIYLIATDENTPEDYLLALSQPSTELVYDPEGELRLRLQIKIQNLNIADLYEFKYTQATEVGDHNLDQNAHPPLQQAMNRAGIYVQAAQNKYNGQFFDAFPNIAPTVSNRNVVYFNTINNRFENAVADGTDAEKAVGIYLSQENIVVNKGIIDFPHGFAPYTRLYLSESLQGLVSLGLSDIQIGYTLPNNRIMVDIKVAEQSQAIDFDGDFTVNLTPPVIRELTLEDPNGILWDILVADDGLLFTQPNSTREPDPLFRIPKINLSFAQIIVDEEGVLAVASPPITPGLISDEFYYLESPDGTSWKLSVNLANEIVTQSFQNAFLVKSENDNHFAVRQSDVQHALTYLQIYTSEFLPTTPIVIDGLLPMCFYNNGTNNRPIFFDGTNWRYFSDNSIV